MCATPEGAVAGAGGFTPSQHETAKESFLLGQDLVSLATDLERARGWSHVEGRHRYLATVGPRESWKSQHLERGVDRLDNQKESY